MKLLASDSQKITVNLTGPLISSRKTLCCEILFLPGTDSYDDNNGSVPEERLQRRGPVAQDNEDLVVKGNTSTCTLRDGMLTVPE